MAACLQPLRATALSRAVLRSANRTVRCMAGGGAAAGLEYPKPTVFPAVGPHQSTLIMLHGLGESSIDVCSARLAW